MFFHCAQREEFTKAPSFSAKQAAGSRKTSVSIAAASALLDSISPRALFAFQKLDVSVSKQSATISHFNLKGRQHFRSVGPVRHGIHAESNQAFHLTGVHPVEDESPAVVVGLAELGEKVIAEAVLFRGIALRSTPSAGWPRTSAYWTSSSSNWDAGLWAWSARDRSKVC